MKALDFLFGRRNHSKIVSGGATTTPPSDGASSVVPTATSAPSSSSSSSGKRWLFTLRGRRGGPATTTDASAEESSGRSVSAAKNNTVPQSRKKSFLGNPYVVSVPTLNWANEHRVGIIDSGWNPTLGTTVAFLQEADNNRCALYIEPDQLRFLYPWTIEGNFCAQAFIFTRNVASGKIDLMHRVKPFDGREDVRIYRNCTCFALSCESEVRRLDPKTETLEYDESVIKLTSEYCDKVLQLSVAMLHKHPDRYGYVFEAINAMLNTRSVTPVTSLRRHSSVAAMTDALTASNRSTDGDAALAAAATTPRSPHQQPRLPLTNRVYPTLFVLYDDMGNVPPPYTAREDSSAETHEAVQAQAATAWAPDAAPVDAWQRRQRADSTAGLAYGGLIGGGPAPADVEDGVPLAGEAKEVEPIVYVQACV